MWEMHPSLLLLACTYLMNTWALPAYAGKAQASFAVRINLQNADIITKTGLCRSGTRVGTFGAAVTVFCSTGVDANFSGNNSSLPWTSMQDSSYRMVTQLTWEGESLGTIDSYAGGGATSSWRMIRLGNRDYLEMMVHW